MVDRGGRLYDLSHRSYAGAPDLLDFFGPLISGKMALLSERRADEKEPI